MNIGDDRVVTVTAHTSYCPPEAEPVPKKEDLTITEEDDDGEVPVQPEQNTNACPLRDLEKTYVTSFK